MCTDKIRRERAPPEEASQQFVYFGYIYFANDTQNFKAGNNMFIYILKHLREIYKRREVSSKKREKQEKKMWFFF